MTTFTDICENEETLYVCDSCGETFKAKDIKLMNASPNMSRINLPVPIIIIDKSGDFIKTASDFTDGDRVLACPNCSRVHLFGFNTVGG